MTTRDHRADRRWRAAHAKAERRWLDENAADASSVRCHALDGDATQRVSLVGTIAFHQVFEVARYLHQCLDAGTCRFIVDVSEGALVARGPMVLALNKVSRRATRAGGGVAIVADGSETFTAYTEGEFAGLLDVVQSEDAARGHLDREQARLSRPLGS